MKKDNEDTIVLKSFDNEMEAELLIEQLKSHTSGRKELNVRQKRIKV